MRLKAYSVKQKVDPQTGKPTGEIEGFYFNNLTFAVKPYWMTLRNEKVNPTHPEQLTFGANAVSAPIGMFVTDEGAFEGAYLSYQSTGACLVELIDDTRKFNITGRPCHVDTVFGTGQEVAIMPESLFLDKREAVIFRATDISGDANTIRPVIHGVRIFSDRARDPAVDQYIKNRLVRSRYMLPYFCPLDEDKELDAAETGVPVNFTQDGTCHFEVKKICYSSDYSFKFKIRDESGQEITQNYIHCTAGLGVATEPFMTYGPWVIRAGGIVQFTFDNLSAQYENTIYLTLIGRVFFV